MAATAEAKEKRTRKAVAKKCHMERCDGTDKTWRPVNSFDDSKVEMQLTFAGETEAKKYVIDNGLTGTFRCVWVGSEFVAEEKKRVSIK